MKRLERPTVVLVFHANKDHSEIPWGVLRDKLLGGELLEMLRMTRVPIELSVQAEDVLFWDRLAPEVVNEIFENCNIGVLRGIHTHTMPTAFPAQDWLISQVAYGNSFLKERFSNSLSFVGGLPEVDVDSEILFILQAAGWRGVLALEDLEYLYEYRCPEESRKHLVPLLEEDEGGLRMIKGNILQSGGLPIIVASAAEMRGLYLRYFRGFATAQEFADALRIRAEGSDTNLVVFYTDLEVPQINALNGASRLDLWEDLFSTLASSGIQFSHLNDIKDYIEQVALTAMRLEIKNRPVPKWHNNPGLHRAIAELSEQKADMPDWLYHRLTVSDTFSSFSVKSIDLPVQDKVGAGIGEVHIRTNNAERMAAFNYFLALARGENPDLPEDRDVAWFVKNTCALYEE